MNQLIFDFPGEASTTITVVPNTSWWTLTAAPSKAEAFPSRPARNPGRRATNRGVDHPRTEPNQTARRRVDPVADSLLEPARGVLRALTLRRDPTERRGSGIR